MPRKPPPRAPKGTRFGKGRAKGTPNRVTVEARILVSELVNNPQYQYKLRRDFTARKVHPTIESLVWAYHIGKPTQPIAVSGSMTVDVHAQLAEERRILATLDLSDLERFANESQAIVNKALELAQIAQNQTPIPQDVVVEALPDKAPSESLAIMAGSNNERSVTQSDHPDVNSVTPTDTER